MCRVKKHMVSESKKRKREVVGWGYRMSQNVRAAKALKEPNRSSQLS